ncbi:diguanylate cyclase [Aquabacterium sp.]|uniref:GGDEF domain-containing protein n=1 Tax=Aquabacterium sp. TaxID=1872578 RepID=UPI0019AFF9A9|nr:diguanylate cyclase [Aquabacterium sp.]MBC7701027.1 GGDEF domain-containing protein [Aquabacterium sp.]
MSISPIARDFVPTTGFGEIELAPVDYGPVSADSAEQIDQLLSNGFPTLRFPAVLERRFQHDTAADRLRVIIITAALVVILFNGYLLTDLLMIPDVFAQAVTLRTGLFTPVCLIGLYVLIKTPHPFFREILVLLAGVLAASIALYLPSISKDPLAGPYLVGLAMVVMFSHSVAQMRFWMAVALDVFIAIGTVVALRFIPPAPIEVMVPSGLVLISTVTFTLFGCYSLERDERQNWLLRIRETNLLAALKTANERLDKISRSDLLTQVANRRHFDEFLTQVWERAELDGSEVSLIMIDVDHFKTFNDHYGHPAGDECLRQVAGTLKRRLRRPGDLVARFGGEEFIAVLTGTPLPVALQAADRIRVAIERLRVPHVGSPTSSFVTVSVGVAAMRPIDRGTSQKTLLTKADESLYRAKNSGRNRVWPDPDAGRTA